MNIPQRWRDVLAAIQAAGFPEAIIAGGALRDLDHGKPIKDVDIFVDAKGIETLQLKKQLDAAFGYEGVGIFENPAADLDEDYTWEGVVVAGVWDWVYAPSDFLGQPKFQVIAVEKPEGVVFRDYVIDDFDIGLCQQAFDGVLECITTAYLDDAALKTLTVTRAPSYNALQRTRGRLGRIQLKYPEHRIVIPDEFLALEREFEVAKEEEPAF